MFLNHRSDLYRLDFPKVFIPEEIKARWQPYVNRLPYPTKNISDIINLSIQSVSIPNVNYEPVEQSGPGYQQQAKGTTKKWRGSLSQEILSSREFTITMRLADGCFNYWIMNETFYHWYAYEITKPYTFTIPVHVLDSEGNMLYSIHFLDVLFTSVGEFDLNMTDGDASVKTFTLGFNYNELELKFNLG